MDGEVNREGRSGRLHGCSTPFGRPAASSLIK
jgi:hypothetical protein